MRKRELASGGHVYEAAVWWPHEGGRRQRWVYGSTVEQLERARAAMLADRDAARAVHRVGGDRMRVAQLAEVWLARHVCKLDPSTRDFYRIALTYRVAPFIFDRAVRDVDRRTIEHWIGELAEAGHSPRSCNAALATVRAMFGKAVDWSIVASNPCERVAKVAEQQRAVRVYEPDDVDAIAEALSGLRRAPRRNAPPGWVAQRDAAMVRVLAYTGLRLGELLALTVDSYRNGRSRTGEARSAWLAVTRQVDARTGLVKPYTKTKRGRDVPVLETVQAELDALLDAYPVPGGRRAPLFPKTLDGDHARPGSWRSAHFRRGALEAGFPDARPHELRHTFASLMIARGITPARLATWIGHADASTTLRIYTHLFERVEDDVLRRVDADLFLPLPATVAA